MASMDRITHDPAVMGGKACIRGMRVTVSMVLGLLATGETRDSVLKSFPYLVDADIDAALEYAALQIGGGLAFVDAVDVCVLS